MLWQALACGVGFGQGFVLLGQAQGLGVNERVFSVHGNFLQNADLRQLPEMARRSVPGDHAFFHNILNAATGAIENQVDQRNSSACAALGAAWLFASAAARVAVTGGAQGIT